MLAVLFMLGALALAIIGQRGPGSVVERHAGAARAGAGARRAGGSGGTGAGSRRRRHRSGDAASRAGTGGSAGEPNVTRRSDRRSSYAEVAELADAPA